MNAVDPSSPNSQLPVLDLGNSEAVLARLDSLVHDGGLSAVARWVQEDLRPGRRISYRGRRGDEAELATISDRSLWRIDPQGKPSGEAVISPWTDEKIGGSELFAVWSRPMAAEPFLLRLRTRASSE
jgi:hypothetical protein